MRLYLIIVLPPGAELHKPLILVVLQGAGVQLFPLVIGQYVFARRGLAGVIKDVNAGLGVHRSADVPRLLQLHGRLLEGVGPGGGIRVEQIAVP